MSIKIYINDFKMLYGKLYNTNRKVEIDSTLTRQH